MKLEYKVINTHICCCLRWWLEN